MITLKRALVSILLLHSVCNVVVAHATEFQEETVRIKADDKTEYGEFKLIPLEKLLSYDSRRTGIRVTIRPSFDYQTTYEFFFNYFETEVEKKHFSRSLDTENVLVRQIQLTDDSIKKVQEYNKRIYEAEQRVWQCYPQPWDEQRQKQANEEMEVARKKVPKIEYLDLAIKSASMDHLQTSLVEWEKRVRRYLVDYDKHRGLDGVTYEIAVKSVGMYDYRLTIWSPREGTEAQSILNELGEIVESIGLKWR